jgi:hypothetical protein
MSQEQEDDSTFARRALQWFHECSSYSVLPVKAGRLYAEFDAEANRRLSKYLPQKRDLERASFGTALFRCRLLAALARIGTEDPAKIRQVFAKHYDHHVALHFEEQHRQRVQRMLRNYLGRDKWIKTIISRVRPPNISATGPTHAYRTIAAFFYLRTQTLGSW